MVFGKYCLLERISVGGMAEVFRAKPLPAHESDKMLALKRILPHLAEDDEFITMFVDEAKLTVQLEHPNIVETYELGNFQSSYYILMEYIAGADVLTLQKRLRERRRIMSVAQACYVAEKVARGLHHAHNACDEQGRPFDIIHRDVSPQNIRLTYDGRVKLIDFGIAKAAVQRTKTQVGVLKGKFGYMSPEQVHGETIDHRSDVFALGTTLWEMLTNRRLFKGDNEFETLQMVKNLDVSPPSEKNSQVPPAVDDIVMRALSEHPDERYQTAEQLAEALVEFVSSINEPYTQRHLSRWMTETFDEEFAEERRKRELYRQIRQPEDVKWFNREYVEESDPEQQQEAAGESVVDGDGGGEDVDESDERSEAETEDDQIWDPDFAPEDGEEVDHEQFAADHTVVAAGGFDPSAHEDEDDEIIAPADEEIIELDERELDAIDPDQTSGDMPAVDQSSEDETDQPSDEIPVGEPVDRAEGGDEEPEDADPADEAPTVAMETSSASGEIVPPEEASGTHPAADSLPDGDGKHVWRAVSAIVAVIMVLSLAIVVGYTAIGANDGSLFSNAPKASLVVTVEPKPGSDGTFRIDGEKRGSEAPMTVPNLEAGTHEIEVEYPGFSTARRTVELEPGALRTVTIELTADPEASGRIRLSIAEVEGLEVFVDGEALEWNHDRRVVPVKPGRHLVEVLADRRRPWSRIVELEAGETVVEHVDLAPRAVSLEVETSKTSRVTVDGEEVGETPVTLEGLSATEIHHLEVEAVDGDDTYETHLGFPRLGQSRFLIDFNDPPVSHDEEAFGWLTASTGGDWWLVRIDGRQTGETTPIALQRRLPVAAGDRSVEFRRGNQTHRFEVEVEAGEEVSIVEELSFEWNGSM